MRSASLKAKNRIPLFGAVIVNVLIYITVFHPGTTIDEQLFRAAPAGLVFLVLAILNGLIGATTKARLVFLRWRHPLPGSRAFSKFGAEDPRVDLARLRQRVGNFPKSGPTQNRLWYRLYREIDNEPAVEDAHTGYLLARDYTSLSAMFIIFLGSAALIEFGASPAAITYVAFLALQFFSSHSFGPKRKTGDRTDP